MFRETWELHGVWSALYAGCPESEFHAFSEFEVWLDLHFVNSTFTLKLNASSYGFINSITKLITMSLVVFNHQNICVAYHVYGSRMRMLCEWNNAFLKVIRLHDAHVTIVTTVIMEKYAMFLNVHKQNLNYQTIIMWKFRSPVTKD